jgi:hypothetical protein
MGMLPNNSPWHRFACHPSLRLRRKEGMKRKFVIARRNDEAIANYAGFLYTVRDCYATLAMTNLFSPSFQRS